MLAVDVDEKTDGETKKASPRQVMRTAGAFVLASLAVHEWIDGQTLFALLQLLGGALLVAGGMERRKDERACPYRARGVVRIDPDATVRALSELCQAVDICVSDLTLVEKEAGAMRLSGTADGAMLDLLCVLMEAKQSGRDDLAMRSLGQAEQYLHMLGVQILPYGEDTAQHYDALPTLGEARVIRPALMKEGKLLRRGVAACRMEGGVRA